MEKAGYTAALPAASRADGRRRGATPDTTRPLRDRLIVVGRAGRAGDRYGDGPGAAVHQLAVAVAHAGRAGRGLGRRWPFHRAAWTNLRHGAATMDTLVSLGTLAAFGWSL